MLAVRKGVGKPDRGAEGESGFSLRGRRRALRVDETQVGARAARRCGEIDRRPPVLLLRSFDDDMMLILNGACNSKSTDLHRKGMTFERVLQDRLAPFGPFIAIGRPQEPLSPLGAARDYAPDAAWQDEAQQRIRDAAVVVLVIGTSQGLAWELSRCATWSNCIN